MKNLIITLGLFCSVFMYSQDREDFAGVWQDVKNEDTVLVIYHDKTIAFIWVDSHHEISFTVEQEWIGLLKQLLTTVYIAYFGSRGVEKFKSISNNNNK